MASKFMNRDSVLEILPELCNSIEQFFVSQKDHKILFVKDSKPAFYMKMAEAFHDNNFHVERSEMLVKLIGNNLREMEDSLKQPVDDIMIYICEMIKSCSRLKYYFDSSVLSKELKKFTEIFTKHVSEKRKNFHEMDMGDYLAPLLNDHNLVELLQKAIEHVGIHGYIDIQEGNSLEDNFRITRGHSFDTNTAYVSQEKEEWNNPLILVSSISIITVEEILPFMTEASKKKRPLIIIAEHMEEKPLHAFRYNIAHGGFNGTFIQAPKYGTEREEYLSDIALVTGSQVMSLETGGFDFGRVEYLGQADRVTADRSKVRIFQNDPSISKIVSDRVNYLKEKNQQTEFIEERIRFLNGEIAVLSIGGIPSVRDSKIESLKLLLERVRLDEESGLVDSENIYCEFIEICWGIESVLQESMIKALKLASEQRRNDNSWSLLKYQLGMEMAMSTIVSIMNIEYCVENG